MNDFTNYPQIQNNNSITGTDSFITKALIPLGSIIIGTIGLLASSNKFPVRIERLLKSVNKKFDTSICIIYFQDVKPL